jgi:hypothetical protein
MQLLVVRVEEEEVGAAEALLRFMYTGELAADVAGSPEQLMRTFHLADRFQARMRTFGITELIGWVGPVLGLHHEAHHSPAPKPHQSQQSIMGGPGWGGRAGPRCNQDL